MKIKGLFFFFFVATYFSSYSQILEGNIFDKLSEKPIESATVYLDGTTISTITDKDGYFKINASGNNQSTLVVSFVGYVSLKIENPFQYKKIKSYLEEDSITMDEVFIGKSIFTRKSMLKVFREQFLGKSKAGLSCKIENEDDIDLFFDEQTNTLSASSRVPLRVKNSYLGYEVFFDLVDFTLNYSQPKLDSFYLRRSAFSGTSFFKDISKRNKSDKKRKESFLGSTPHLMMTIANESWQKEKFALFVDKFQADPKLYFKVQDTLGIKLVTLIKEPETTVPIYKPVADVDYTKPMKLEIMGYEEKKVNFNILYDGNKQSRADFLNKEFIVDENGNYSPVYVVMFGGYLGSQKLGDMLPSDYYQTIKGKL